MFRMHVGTMEKALSVGLVAAAALLFTIMIISPNHGWTISPGKAALEAAEARDALESALVTSAP